MKLAGIVCALAVAVSAGWSEGAAATDSQGAAPPPAAAFGPAWSVLIGDWASAEPAQAGSGASSFRFELDHHAIVRRNRAEVATGPAKTATPHEDLMVIYPAGSATSARALYVDNEGHVITYAADWSPDLKVLTFVSEPVPGEPRFRLTYRFESASDVSIAFEIAAPASPTAFKPYVTGRARRTSAAPAR